jgi:hypothetical protein
MGTHDRINGSGQLAAGIAPFTNTVKPKDCASRNDQAEVLMSDRVSPLIQFNEPLLADFVATIQVHYSRPENKAKSIVVGANVPRIGIASIQFPIQYEES